MPETRNPVERMGSEAAARNAELVKTKRVTLVRDPADEDTDSYGRFLRYVIVEDTFVDYQLVREGLAFLFLSDDTCSPDLFAAYETAQKDKAGIFAPTPKPEN
jgi:micrococcal nuclease